MGRSENKGNLQSKRKREKTEVKSATKRASQSLG